MARRCCCRCVLTEVLVFPSVWRRPTSLDAFVFGFVAPLYKANLPSSALQPHLQQLDNITRFCDNILAVYFGSDRPRKSPAPTGNVPTFSNTRVGNAIAVFLLWSSFRRNSALWTRSLITCSSCLFSSGLPSPGSPQPVQETKDANLQKLTQLVNKESNLIEKVPLLSP